MMVAQMVLSWGKFLVFRKDYLMAVSMELSMDSLTAVQMAYSSVGLKGVLEVAEMVDAGVAC